MLDVRCWSRSAFALSDDATATIQHLASSIWPMSLSRKCVPFTPFEGELAKSTVALVTAAGVHLKDQEPFNIADELGDLGYRIIPEDVDATLIMDGGLTDINLGNGWSQNGNVYSHEGSGPTLAIVVNMGAGSVTLKE